MELTNHLVIFPIFSVGKLSPRLVYDNEVVSQEPWAPSREESGERGKGWWKLDHSGPCTPGH